MKTSVNMIRPMGNFNVTQRTKDGMFNATELLKQWNEHSDTSKKEMGDFFRTKSTKEFIETMWEELNGADQPISDNQIFTTPKNQSFFKDGNSPYLKTRGKYGGTWMHPYLFIDFAMWLNPKFKLQVIKFVYDQLIEYRHKAGDNYKELTKAAARLKNVDYSLIAKGLNYIVFGKHQPGIRQNASQTELEYMNSVQKNLAFAIDMGHIKSFDNLMHNMRVLYHKKYTNFLDPQKLSA